MERFFVKIVLILLSLLIPLWFVACEGKKNDSTDPKNAAEATGVITGIIKDTSTNKPLKGVVISAVAGEATFTAESAIDGSFILEIKPVQRTDGYDVQFSKEGYEAATKSAVFDLPNLRVELGTVLLTPVSTEKTPSGKIIGLVKDSATIKGIAGVKVSVDVKGTIVTTDTDLTGAFTLEVKGAQAGEGYSVQFSKDGYQNATRAASFDQKLEVDLDVVSLTPSTTSVTSGGTTSGGTTSGGTTSGGTTSGGTTSGGTTSGGTTSGGTTSGGTTSGGTTSGGDASEDVIEPTIKTGVIQGTIKDNSGSPLKEVQIFLSIGTSTLNMKSGVDGTFSMSVEGVQENENYKIAFSKEGYEKNSQVISFDTSDLKVDMATVSLTNEDITPVETHAGQLTGIVKDVVSGNPLEGAKIYVFVNDLYYAASGVDGAFALELNGIQDAAASAILIKKTGYQDFSNTILFASPTYNLEMGVVSLSPVQVVAEKKIVGTVIDSFSASGLANVLVTVQDSKSATKTALTNENGEFSISGKDFYLESSYTLSLTKTNYVERSDVSVTISGDTNLIDKSIVRLYKQAGKISGDIKDEATGTPLKDTVVTATDSLGAEVSATTDAQGHFTLASDYFLLGETYQVVVSGGSDFHPTQTSVKISTTSDQSPNLISEVTLLKPVSVSGIVKDTNGNPISNLKVTVEGLPDEVITDGEGKFTLSGTSYLRNTAYKLTFTKEGYTSETVTSSLLGTGVNIMGDIQLAAEVTTPPVEQPSSGWRSLSGKVVDYWKDAIGLSPTALQDATVKVTDDGTAIRSDLTDANGSFEISGNFTVAKNYTLTISKSGFTGTQEMELKSEVTMGNAPYTSGTFALYPLGVFTKLKRSTDSSSTELNLNQQLKQTYEKFLTGKTGFTLSARDDNDLNKANTFYIHLDDSSFPSSLPSGLGKHSNYLAVGGAQKKGALTEGLGSDSRITNTQWEGTTTNWGLKNFVLYHFYAAQAGTYTIETTSSTDTVLILYDASGTKKIEDDNSGTDKNAKITYTVQSSDSGSWYFVQVKGANDSTFGLFEIQVSGPELSAQITTLPQTWDTTTADKGIVLSWYDQAYHKLYIAAPDESVSSGSITISHFGAIGKIVRGQFPKEGSDGVMRAVDDSGATVEIQKGYFNILRSE
ncbi:carboxypeptidase regulatory-like domain-containing protein [Deltaproteobacteria bacterium TL4]